LRVGIQSVLKAKLIKMNAKCKSPATIDAAELSTQRIMANT